MNPPAMQETLVQFLGWEDPLEKGLGHDLRNELGDGTREGFCAANEEFLRNCIRLAAYHCRDDYRRRNRAVSAAIVLYEFVSADRFGWRAWQEAKDRHAAKLASDNSVWNTKE